MTFVQAERSENHQPSRLLITGGAGFIGSNFVHHWCSAYPKDRVVVLDALTYAGNRQNLADLEGVANLRFVKGDICDRSIIDKLLAEEAIDKVVHFAAESHVDRSILGPGAFVQTNVVGTFTLIESFRQYWQAHGEPKDYRFLHVSTDEVFGSLELDEPAFTENTPYSPNSPYSASKAGSDHLVRAYFHTYKLPTLITNCSNNYGPYHYPEKLIPLMIINILLGKPLTIYGDGQNVRDWLYVEDHCRALDVVIHRGIPGETYNVGGNNEVKNMDLVCMICDLMDVTASELPVYPSRKLITSVKDRPGHDRRYAINSSKIQTELYWLPKVNIKDGLEKTVKWYLENRNWWLSLSNKEPQDYYSNSI